MTRVDQALRWWKNNVKDGRVFASLIPERHKEVLRKNYKIQFYFGIVAAEDFYRLK